jgi:hypothetical protein
MTLFHHHHGDFTMATATKKTTKNGKAPKSSPSDVSVVHAYTSERGASDMPRGANFSWELTLQNPDAKIHPIRDGKLCKLSLHVIKSEDMERCLREGLFHYHQVVDMGNGFHAVARLHFEGLWQERNADPDQNDKELIRPFRDTILELLESHPRVRYCEMGQFPNGDVRFEFSVAEDDGGESGLRLTLERGDN